MITGSFKWDDITAHNLDPQWVINGAAIHRDKRLRQGKPVSKIDFTKMTSLIKRAFTEVALAEEYELRPVYDTKDKLYYAARSGGKFRLIEGVVGESFSSGTFADVFKVQDCLKSKMVVIKKGKGIFCMLGDEASRLHTLSDAERMRQFSQHQKVPGLQRGLIGVSDEGGLYATRYYLGECVFSFLLEKKNEMTLNLKLEGFAHILVGLIYLYRQGYFYTDFSLENFLLVEEGRLVLGDIGGGSIHCETLFRNILEQPVPPHLPVKRERVWHQDVVRFQSFCFEAREEKVSKDDEVKKDEFKNILEKMIVASVGIVLHQMLFKVSPFRVRINAETRFRFNTLEESNTPNSIINFIKIVCKEDPQKRPSLERTFELYFQACRESKLDLDDKLNVILEQLQALQPLPR